MMPDRARIERLVPHAGAMCLIDAVTLWDAAHIACRCAEPGPMHPLAREGEVPAIAAAEYAAQATALHGALVDEAFEPRAGVLAKLIDVELQSPRFPANGGALTVRADILGRLASGCLYSFEVANSSRPIARGRLIVAFGPSAAP
ncbi:MAG: phosphotransferase [Ramlibacter sp.]|nr:phosphotransferase [Ramlibacter sp.]